MDSIPAAASSPTLSEGQPVWVDGVFLVAEMGPRHTYREFTDDFGMEFYEVELSRYVNAAPGMAVALGLITLGAFLPMFLLTVLGTTILVVVSIQHKLFGRTFGSMVTVGREAKQEAYKRGRLVEGELRGVELGKGRKARFSYRYHTNNEEYLRSIKVRLPHDPGRPVQEKDHLVEAILQRAKPGAAVDVLVHPESPELAVLIYKSIREPGSPRPR